MKTDNQISLIDSIEIDMIVLRAIGKLKILSCFTEHIKDANYYIKTGDTQFEDDNFSVVDHIEGVLNLLDDLKKRLVAQSEYLINNRKSIISLN